MRSYLLNIIFIYLLLLLKLKFWKLLIIEYSQSVCFNTKKKKKTFEKTLRDIQIHILEDTFQKVCIYHTFSLLFMNKIQLFTLFFYMIVLFFEKKYKFYLIFLITQKPRHKNHKKYIFLIEKLLHFMNYINSIITNIYTYKYTYIFYMPYIWMNLFFSWEYLIDFILPKLWMNDWW